MWFEDPCCVGYLLRCVDGKMAEQDYTFVQSEDCEFNWVAKGVSEMVMISTVFTVIRMKAMMIVYGDER